jgi:hypothetical protein
MVMKLYPVSMVVSRSVSALLIFFILSGLNGCDWSKKVHGTINNQDQYDLESEDCKIQLSCVPSHGNIDMLKIYITCCPGSTINIDSLQLSVYPGNSAKINSLTMYDEGNKIFIDKKSFTASAVSKLSLTMNVARDKSCIYNTCKLIIPPGQLIYYNGRGMIKDTLRITL